MFCEQCKSFWKDATSQVEITKEGNADNSFHGKILWKHHSVALHRGLGSLENSSDQGCPTCRIIYSTPSADERRSIAEDSVVFLAIEPKDQGHAVLLTRFEVAGEIVMPQRMIATYAGLRTDDELVSALMASSHSDNDNTGSRPALELAAFWLKRCLSEHEDCSKSISSPPFMPTRVIDVGSAHGSGDVRLIETAHESILDVDRRYAALSHCWGKIEIITTKKGTLQDRLRNISFSKLSKTFQDTVEVARQLSIRYIWIDSLCIVQDDAADWEKEAAQMSPVYRHATLTIVAAHAPGGDVGCFEQRDGLLQLPFVVDIPSRQAGPEAAPFQGLFTSYGRSKGLGDATPPLYGRAWVLQEQLLSPRMLIFDGPQLRWECLGMHGSERSPIGGLSRHIGHHKTIRSGITEDREYFTLPGYDDDFAYRMQLHHWCLAVMDFTHRGMTESSDRLVAVAGIADAIQSRTKNKYIAGLWRDQLQLGLLWSIPHEMEYTGTTNNAFDFERNKKIRQNKPLAPSWSWVSVTAPVVYPVTYLSNKTLRSICEIQTAEINGTAARQTGTLTVRGHVRTCYVNSVYPYAIRDATRETPKMAFGKPDGSKHLFTYGSQSFHPHDFFLFSAHRPTKRTAWQLMRGMWRPDEVFDPQTPITFLALAQRTHGSSLSHVSEDDPLLVYTLGLVPTGRAENEYRRVGFGAWEDCAWYGYMCGPEDRPGREIEMADGWRGMLREHMSKAMGRQAVAGVGVRPAGVHEHRSRVNTLPEPSVYHHTVDIETTTLVII